MNRCLAFIASFIFWTGAYAAQDGHVQLTIETTSFSSYDFSKARDGICVGISDQVAEVYCSSESKINKTDKARVQIKVFSNKAKMKISMGNLQELMKGMVFEWEVPVDPAVWKKILVRFLEHIQDENVANLKKFALSNGLQESAVVGKSTDGYFHKETQEKLSENEALKHFLAEDYTSKDGTKIKRNRHLLRAILEVGGILLAGGSFYQVLDFDEDADFEYNWEGVKGKFTEGIRFDDNERKYNLYGHPISGTIYYSIARSNGLNSFESMLIAFAGSALWEFIPEFAEVASVNDQFQTGLTGPAIGEAMFQLGEFFNRGGNSVMHKILGAVMGPGIHDLIDGYHGKRAENLDRFGFDVDYWHRFNVFALAAANTEKNGIAYRLGFNMQLNTLPGSQSEGKETKWVGDTLFVELAAQLGLNQEQKAEFLFHAKSVYAGLVSKNIFIDENLKKNGYSLIFGPSSSFYLKDGTLGTKKDFIGLVNFLGTTLDMSFFIKDLKIRICFDVFASFTSIRSFALEKYRSQVPDSVIKSTLNMQEYSNGIGLVGAGKFEVEYKRFDLQVDGRQVITSSLNGLERNQELITDNLRLSERRLTVDSTLAYTILPRQGIQLGLGHQYNQGTSVIKSEKPDVTDSTASNSEHIWFLKLGGKF